jgi:hypothetical protein
MLPPDIFHFTQYQLFFAAFMFKLPGVFVEGLPCQAK